MTDTATTAPAAESTSDEGGKPEYTPPATQGDLDKIVADRVSRERAKYGDYAELKAKAAKLDDIEQANKTEIEKAAARADAAEARAKELELMALRLEVAAAQQVPAELLTGSSKEELEASAAALIKFRGSQAPQQRADVPAEGRDPHIPLNGDGLEAALRKKLGIR